MEKLSSVGLIGDVHARSEQLEAALHFLRVAEVQQILCVGDVADGEGSVDRCCELLNQPGIATVRGNHDRWFMAGEMRSLTEATPLGAVSAESQAFIQSLPPTREFETVAGRLLLCHGLGDNDMRRLTPDDYGYALECNEILQLLISRREFRFVVGGHTHRRMVRHFGGLTVINPGTLCCPHEPGFAIMDLDSRLLQFYRVAGPEVSPVGEPVSLRPE